MSPQRVKNKSRKSAKSDKKTVYGSYPKKRHHGYGMASTVSGSDEPSADMLK